MYHWDFGDGHSAEGDWSEGAARLNHVYQVSGNYTAVLTVTDDKGMTGKREVTITVLNKNPVANIVVSPREGSVPLNVKLNGSQSYDPDGTNITYTWDFGDNTFGNGMIIEHTYEKAQTYQLSLIVTDPYGASGRAETTIEVKSAPLILGIQPWWLGVGVLVIVAGAAVALRIKRPTSKDGQGKDIQSPPMLSKRKFPQLPVNIETHSGAEYSAGIDSEDTKLTGISVDIRSGIWKEGDKI
jgi:PKD repeat protein